MPLDPATDELQFPALNLGSESSLKAAPQSAGPVAPITPTAGGLAPRESSTAQRVGLFLEGLGAGWSGQVPLGVKLRQQDFENQLAIRQQDLRERGFNQALQAFSEHQLQSRVDNERDFMRNFPMLRQTLNTAKTPEERLQIADTMRKAFKNQSPNVPYLIDLAERQPAYLAGANMIIDRMVQSGKLPAPTTALEYKQLLSLQPVQDATNTEGRRLNESALAYTMSPLDGKVVNPNGMSEEEFRKAHQTGLNKMKMPNPQTGQPMLDAQEEDFAKLWLDSPKGQEWMNGIGVRVTATTIKQAGTGLTRERAMEVQRLEDQISKLHDMEPAEYPGGQTKLSADIADLSAQRRMILGSQPKTPASSGSKAANDFVSSETGGKYTSFEAWAKDDPAASKRGYQKFRIENPIQIVAAGTQTKADVKQVETAQDHLIVLDRVKNNIDAQMKLIDRLITPKNNGLVYGGWLYAEAKAGKNPDASTYMSFRDAFASNMARELGGEKGVLTDVDITRWANILPNLYDNYATKQLKKKTTYDFFNFAYQQQQQVAAGKLSLAQARKLVETKGSAILSRVETPQEPPATGGVGTSSIKESLRGK